jgi:N-acetylglucosaminyldiphosphoundecaprenol N-acetyl-beta-D-mannosaminyltransferase
VGVVRRAENGGREPLDFFGVRIDPLDEATTVATIGESLANGRGGWVVTPNVEQLRLLASDVSLRELVASADLSVADGMPLIWASRVRGAALPERVPGSHLIWSLSSLAAAEGRSIFLLGGSDQALAERAGEVLSGTNPGLRIAGALSPPFGFDEDPELFGRICLEVAGAQPDVVFCGLGFPKQEHVIRELRRMLPRAWFIGCGASILMVAGERTQAPDWMQASGLEWLHRLRQEPVRLFRRYIIHDIPFAVRLLASSAMLRWQGVDHRAGGDPSG